MRFLISHIIKKSTLSATNQLRFRSLGVDGAWSTFLITAGTPPQQLQVVASTEVASTWVVAPEGCGPNNAANCTQARGGEYDNTKSSTWNVKDMFQLGAESNLGYTGNAVNGSYGYDTVGLPGKPGAANISVNHQVIAGITTEAFYIGSLGLSNQPINFTDSTDSSPSLLTSLKNQNLIPSLSYGYTAGASYRKQSHSRYRIPLTLLRAKRRCWCELDIGWLRCIKIHAERCLFYFRTNSSKAARRGDTVDHILHFEDSDAATISWYHGTCRFDGAVLVASTRSMPAFRDCLWHFLGPS